ncbi:MAG: hypothetical protein JWQ07_4221 [Ramlibacter sp.]|nr:hypothetical protein [Ramlibacter sp.]
MPATQPSQQNEPVADDSVEGQPRPTPDEDGPHDVPNEKVIEKTLPESAVSGDSGRGG